MNWTSIRATGLELAESKGLEYNDPDLPKTRLRQLATDLGVDRLELHEMDGDALVVEREKGQYTMLLNSGHVKSRHRFSTAHEIAHLLVSPLIGHRAMHRRRFSPGQDDEGRRIEFLCNDMASAILMPRERVEGILDETRPSAQCIPNLVKAFGVSFEAAARRYVNVVSLACSLVKWNMRAGARNEERPISNFALRDGWVKFRQGPSANSSDSRAIGNMTVSTEYVVFYPGRHSRIAPVHIENATVETYRHGRGQYQRMFSFIYLPDNAVKELQTDFKRGGRRRW